MRLRLQFLSALVWIFQCANIHAESKIVFSEGTVFVYSGQATEIVGVQHAIELERVVVVAQKSEDQTTYNFEFTDKPLDSAEPNQVAISRSVRQKDMDGAHKILFRFLQDDPQNLPGLTIFHASKSMMQELIATGSTAFVFADGPIGEGGLFSSTSRKYYRGTLKVIEANAPLDVLVNGVKITVPTLHTSGHLTVGDLSREEDFWLSSDLKNPVIIRAQGGEGNWIQLVRVDDPQPVLVAEQSSAASSITEGLQGSNCRAMAQGIYFDSGSATLLAASSPSLKNIAILLKAHPDWSITVEGHTDNIGSDDDNLDLSKRRAAAVVAALMSQNAISADHLLSKGYGETNPIDSNDTPVGRAHNRRVELARKC